MIKVVVIMGILEQYEAYYNKYRDLYGDRIAILFQVGSFHQLYGVDNEEERICNLSEIAALLNIKETRVSTAILNNSRSNPQLAGFNSVSLDSNVERLVNYGYTVVVINQTGAEGPDGLVRDVAYIQSPSTTIDMTAPRDPYLVSIYVTQEQNKTMGRKYDYIGMSAMDITTGQSFYYEVSSSPGDPDLAMDDMKRFVQTFSPVEVIVNYPEGTTLPSIDSWGFCTANSGGGEDFKAAMPTAYVNTIILKDINSIAFQETILSDMLDIRDPLDTLDLTHRPVATKSLIYLLKFCADHNTALLKAMNKPTLWGTGHYLVLDTRSIIQLGILESYYDQLKTDSVFNMMSSWTVTAVGRRTMRHRLLNCITDPIKLNKRYDDISRMSMPVTVYPDKINITSENTLETMPLHDYLHRGLKGIRDLDRMHRKLVLGTLTPSEFHDLDKNYRQIIKLFQTDPHPEDEQRLNRFIKTYSALLNMNECGKCTVAEYMSDSIFVPGCYPDIDKISADIKYCDQIRTELLSMLSDVVLKSSNCCKYKDGGSTGTGGCWVTFTKPQYVKFDQQFPKGGITLREFTITRDSMTVDTRNKSNIKIEINVLDQLLVRQESLVCKLRSLSIKVYQDLLVKFREFAHDLDLVANCIGLMDVHQAIARVSEKYGYCRPVVAASSDTGMACLQIKQLRHPLVEKKCAYVPHDVELGNGASGMLLYGVNQSGKSCTMKSIGIAIVMAQAGFYVPAKSMLYYPYSNLMTRIIGNDNIDYGLSSYAVEMMELRSILTRANSRTLVLGDEVCHGTESASAVSLVAASLIHLDKVKSSFVFATHLHELSQMPEVSHIRQFHITVKFSPDGRIIYDRQIKEGSGTGLYGIEVAKHLRLPPAVLHDAFTIRNKYFPNTAVPPVPVPSKYNHDRFVSKCEIAGCGNSADHTHHIRYQSEASAAGLVDGYKDINQKDNLIGLCEKHHNDVHHGDGRQQLVIFSRDHYEYRRMLHSLNRKIEIPNNINGLV